MINLIKNTDTTKENTATKRFREEFVAEYGNATKKSLDIIYQEITEK